MVSKMVTVGEFNKTRLRKGEETLAEMHLTNKNYLIYFNVLIKLTYCK